MKIKILLFSGLVFLLSSCINVPDFGDSPQIYYNGIEQTTEADAAGKK